MRVGTFYALISLVALSGTCAADTIDTFTFTANAGAIITGFIAFHVRSDGTAGLSDVIDAGGSSTSIPYFTSSPPPGQLITIPPAAYTLADLSAFSLYPDPAGCATS